MITKFSIQNFKLYKDIDIPLNSLNLLTGINGRGKSTALQTFLLMSQSAQMNASTTQIYLNGSNVNLGNLDDVKNKDISSSENICFTFYYDDKVSVQYLLRGEQPDASELDIEKIIVDTSEFHYEFQSDSGLYKHVSSNNEKDSLFPLFDLLLSNSTIEHYFPATSLNDIKNLINLVNVHYVSADRIGPKNYYENKSLGRFMNVGALGENAVNVLYHKSDDAVNDAIIRGFSSIFGDNYDELSLTIEDNVNYWVDKIFQGAQVRVESITGEDLLKLRIKADKKGTYFKPTNVGYGFSFSLPILVAGLIAKPGEILIVENPEAHLHPYAQAVMAKFLALVASTGVQVLVESHSDHILNGFRIAVKSGIVPPDELNILYFDQRQENFFEKIKVDREGGIDNWPDDFFDQSIKDLDYLLGI